MASAIIQALLLAHLAAFAVPSFAADGVMWRAIAASAHGTTFSTGMSGRQPTEEKAIEVARSVCQERGESCTVVAVFNAGCRYVMLGGRPQGGNVLEPVFLVGVTLEDARHRCQVLRLVCTREPSGGCLNDY